MDLNDDLCRADFFDFVCPKLEPNTNGLTPVAFIDSIDYVQTDGNNNLGGTSGHIKSFLDEMMLTDSLNNNQNGDALQLPGHNTFELLGTFQWSTSGQNENHNQTSPSLTSDPSPNWLLNSGVTGDGEVTTLTNLLDPLFVSYEDSKIDQYFSSNSSVEQPAVISSDLISTTFLNENSGSPATSENDIIPWQKNSEVFCDDSLLRTALQAGNKLLQQTTILAQKPSISEMTELRKVLSFPPLTTSGSSAATGSPTSTDQGSSEANNTTDISSETPYYELKVLDPIFVDSDANIPNVEELIMTRIDQPFGGVGNNNLKKITAISEKKINSTTLSTKWTYATPSDQGKTPRRRNGKNAKNGLKNHNSNNNSNPNHNNNSNNNNNNNSLQNGLVFSPSGSPNNTNSNSSNTTNGSSSTGSSVSSNGNSRKERSLHYCNICCKGFKDKYSVNVHVRTHTGEKPFSCTLCGKNFRQKAHLAKHYQTHAAKGNNHHGKSTIKR